MIKRITYICIFALTSCSQNVDMIKDFKKVDQVWMENDKRLYVLSRSQDNPLLFEYSYSTYYKLGPPPDMINELGFVNEKSVKNLLKDIKEYSNYVPTFYHPNDLSAPVSPNYIGIRYNNYDKVLQYSGNIEKERNRFNLIFDKISTMETINNND